MKADTAKGGTNMKKTGKILLVCLFSVFALTFGMLFAVLGLADNDDSDMFFLGDD